MAIIVAASRSMAFSQGHSNLCTANVLLLRGTWLSSEEFGYSGRFQSGFLGWPMLDSCDNFPSGNYIRYYEPCFFFPDRLIN